MFGRLFLAAAFVTLVISGAFREAGLLVVRDAVAQRGAAEQRSGAVCFSGCAGDGSGLAPAFFVLRSDFAHPVDSIQAPPNCRLYPAHISPPPPQLAAINFVSAVMMLVAMSRRVRLHTLSKRRYLATAATAAAAGAAAAVAGAAASASAALSSAAAAASGLTPEALEAALVAAGGEGPGAGPGGGGAASSAPPPPSPASSPGDMLRVSVIYGPTAAAAASAATIAAANAAASAAEDKEDPSSDRQPDDAGDGWFYDDERGLGTASAGGVVQPEGWDQIEQQEEDQAVARAMESLAAVAAAAVGFDRFDDAARARGSDITGSGGSLSAGGTAAQQEGSLADRVRAAWAESMREGQG